MGKLFERILVPVDGSSESKVSQEMAAFFSRLFGSHVTVFHVVSHDLMTPGTMAFSQEGENYRKDYTPISMSTGQFPRTVRLPENRENMYPQEVVQELTQFYLDKGRGIVSDAVALFKQESIPVEEKLVEGADPSEFILAESEKHDLIVMGSSESEEHKKTRDHLGSNAKKVSAASKSPVLVVRNKSKVSQILVPIDGISKEEKALKYASEIAKTANAKVTLLHVQEAHLLKLEPEIKDFGTQLLKNASSMFGGAVEQKLLLGDPAQTIIQTAEEEDADLIVISACGSERLRHFLLGGVSDHVLNHATLPILLVK